MSPAAFTFEPILLGPLLKRFLVLYHSRPKTGWTEGSDRFGPVLPLQHHCSAMQIEPKVCPGRIRLHAEAVVCNLGVLCLLPIPNPLHQHAGSNGTCWRFPGELAKCSSPLCIELKRACPTGARRLNLHDQFPCWVWSCRVPGLCFSAGFACLCYASRRTTNSRHLRPISVLADLASACTKARKRLRKHVFPAMTPAPCKGAHATRAGTTNILPGMLPSWPWESCSGGVAELCQTGWATLRGSK